MRFFKSIVISILCVLVVDQVLYVARIRPMAIAIRAASMLLNSQRAIIAAQSAALALSSLFHNSSSHKQHSRVCSELDSYAYSIMQTPRMTYLHPGADALIQNVLVHPNNSMHSKNYEEPACSACPVNSPPELQIPAVVMAVSHASARELALRQDVPGSSFFTAYDPVIPRHSWYTVHHTQHEMRVSTDAGLYASIRVKPSNQAALNYEHEQATREQALAIIRMKALEDPSYMPSLCQRIETTINLLGATNSTDFIERLSARLQLPYVEIEEPYGAYVRWAAHKLLSYYCESDGSISPEVVRARVTPYYVQAFIQNGVGEPTYQRFAHSPYLAKVSDAADESWSHAFCRMCTMPFNMVQAAQDNQYNKDLLHVLNACQSYDFAAAYDIQHAYGETQQELIQKIIDYYKSQWQKVLCDADGFYRVAQNDPLYTSLSSTAKQEIARDATILKQYNDILLCRNTMKQTIMQAWNIPGSAPREVHDALYSLLDADAFVDGAHTINSVEQILHSSSEKAYASLVHHCFLSNGILRDFSHYAFANSLPACPELLSAEYTDLRMALNYALYKDHVEPHSDLKQFIESIAEHIRNRTITPAVQQLLVDACTIIPENPWCLHNGPCFPPPFEQPQPGGCFPIPTRIESNPNWHPPCPIIEEPDYGIPKPPKPKPGKIGFGIPIFLANAIVPNKEKPKVPPAEGGPVTEGPKSQPKEETDPQKTPEEQTEREKADAVIAGIIGNIPKQKKKNKGESTIYIKTEDTLEKDFLLFKYKDTKVTKDGKTVGFLPDGRNVVLRPPEDEKPPTLEIQDGYNKIKFRYPN